MCAFLQKWSHVLGRKFPTRRLRAWVQLWRFRALDESFAVLTFHEPLNFYDPPVFVFFLMMWVFRSGWLKWRLRAIKTSHVAGLGRHNQNSPRGKGQKNSLMHLKDETEKTRVAAFFFFFLPPAIIFDTKGGRAVHAMMTTMMMNRSSEIARISRNSAGIHIWNTFGPMLWKRRPLSPKSSDEQQAAQMFLHPSGSLRAASPAECVTTPPPGF